MTEADLSGTCTGGLSRQNLSAPAQFSLDRLTTATRRLSQQIDNLSNSVSVINHSKSLPASPKMSTSAPTKQRTCHNCHAPSDIHALIPTGLNKCPLPHWDGCPGGYVDGKAANGSEWRGCPPDYEPVATENHHSLSVSSDSNKEEFEDTLSQAGERDVFDETSENNKVDEEQVTC